MESRDASGMRHLSRLSALAAVMFTFASALRMWNDRTKQEDLGPRYISSASTLRSQGVRVGSSRASLTVVVFSDYECPYCASFNSSLSELRANLGDSLAIVFRQFPLVASHPHAETAALVALCAARQGRFIPVNDSLYAWREVLGDRPWSDVALAAGVKLLQDFDACVDGPEARELLKQDVLAARRFGIQVTPSLVIGDLLVQGEISGDSLQSLLVTANARGVIRREGVVGRLQALRSSIADRWFN